MIIKHTEDYRILRAREYPSMADLGDALFWQSRGDPGKMDAYLAAVAAVKRKYPKLVDCHELNSGEVNNAP